MAINYITGIKKVGMFKKAFKKTAEMLLVGLGVCLVAVIVFMAIAWAVALQ